MKTSNWLKTPWLRISTGDLATERKQAREEGRDLAGLEGEFDALASCDIDREEFQVRAEALPGCRAEGPDRGRIRLRGALRPRGHSRGPAPTASLPSCSPPEAALLDPGARGLAGTVGGLPPRQGGRRAAVVADPRVPPVPRAVGPWTATSPAGPTPKWPKRCGFNTNRPGLYEESIACMVEDDDTNYNGGRAGWRANASARTSRRRTWRASGLSEIPVMHVCTAEARGLPQTSCWASQPPDSASFRNPYREWIGAPDPRRLLRLRQSRPPGEGGGVGLARRVHQPRQERHLRRDVGGWPCWRRPPMSSTTSRP